MNDKWSGSHGGISSIGPSHEYNDYSIESGYTHCTGGMSIAGTIKLFLHEVAHELYAAPHVMSANNAFGSRWRFPASGWGMMSNAGYSGANAWERWLLGWINLTTGTTQISTDIGSDSDLSTGGMYPYGQLRIAHSHGLA